MNIVAVYIGFLTYLNAPEVTSDEFFISEGNILNLNLISAIAHMPNTMKNISVINKYGFDGKIFPDTPINIIKETCIITISDEMFLLNTYKFKLIKLFCKYYQNIDRTSVRKCLKTSL